ncbi:MAG: hypothetical protein QXL15_04655 [Candidatus Korarchaeota archaeon]
MPPKLYSRLLDVRLTRVPDGVKSTVAERGLSYSKSYIFARLRVS